jgi:hypothetical protein
MPSVGASRKGCFGCALLNGSVSHATKLEDIPKSFYDDPHHSYIKMSILLDQIKADKGTVRELAKRLRKCEHDK